MRNKWLSPAVFFWCKPAGMEIKTLILYATVDGHTLKISERLAEILSREKHLVELHSIENFSKGLQQYEKIIIATSIRYGKHHAGIKAFIDAHAPVLASKKGAFVSVSLVARKAEKAAPHTNPYVVKFLKSIDWVPQLVGVFAGRLDYKRYSLSDRLLIQLIMLLTGGPLKSGNGLEFTDWQKVDAFGRQLAEM
jgi:menaquinone-dependent protoporphyrinogen oxidase